MSCKRKFRQRGRPDFSKTRTSHLPTGTGTASRCAHQISGVILVLKSINRIMPKRKRPSDRRRAPSIGATSPAKRNAFTTVISAPDDRPQRHVPPFATADILPAAAAAIVGGAAYFPIVKGLLSGPSDYTAHAWFAQQFLEKGVLYSPACLLHLLVAALLRLRITPSFQSATLMIAVGSYAALGAVVYFCARRTCESELKWTGRGLPVIIAITLPFVQPAVPWGSFYTIGYIWAEPYYSPTYALLKPLALMGAAFAVYFLSRSRKTNWGLISLCAAAGAAGTLAKPSFAICAVPAILVCSAYKYFRKEPFSQSGVLCGILIPMLAVLIWQHHRTYAGAGDSRDYSDSIVFAPLAVMRIHTSGLAIKYLLSIMFPLSVLALYGKRAWADEGLKFSLLAFILGTTYTYALGEKLHLAAGNFLWSAYMTLFLVYFFTVVFLVKQVAAVAPKRTTLKRVVPCLSVLIAQLTIGLSVHLTYLRMYIPKLWI